MGILTGLGLGAAGSAVKTGTVEPTTGVRRLGQTSVCLRKTMEMLVPLKEDKQDLSRICSAFKRFVLICSSQSLVPSVLPGP